jgi:hypothetical protein
MKKNDMILIISILLLAGAFLVGYRRYQIMNTGDNARVTVTVAGEAYGEYSISEDRTEKILLPDGNYNILEIKDGYVSVSEASCRDKICVNHAHIHYSGEEIVCLPNKVIIGIINGEESDIDGFAGQ